MRDEKQSGTLNIVPSAEEIRRRLGDNIREGRLLRSLLKVAQRNEQSVGSKPQREATSC